ncbi:hypothetical protein Bbelb_088110 [Branchiostoma belcheri]|nr:hypothetical protein Bbelb_088110 [Branchiostoma belcheri]
MTAHKDTRTGKKRKAEAHANDVVKKTKKIPTESDAKEATGNSTKRTSGNAKENRKVALEKGSNSKPVRSNNLNAVEHRSKLNRAHSKQGNIKDKTTDSKNGKMPNPAGKTVDLTKLRSGKVEGSHPRSGRKDRESVRKDGLVSLEIMTVDTSAEAKASVTVQELRTVRRNVSFEERKPNKTTKEGPSCRSLRAPGTRLRSSSCDDDTAKERNPLRRWLGRPTKGRTSGPLKTALFGKKHETSQNALAKKRILDRSKMPPGIKLPRGLKLKKFAVVRLERIDTHRRSERPRLRRCRSQLT